MPNGLWLYVKVEIYFCAFHLLMLPGLLAFKFLKTLCSFLNPLQKYGYFIIYITQFVIADAIGGHYINYIS